MIDASIAIEIDGRSPHQFLTDFHAAEAEKNRYEAENAVISKKYH